MLFSQDKKPLAGFFAIVTVVLSIFVSSLAHAEYGLNFQEPVTDVARDIYGLHMTIFYVCVYIFVAVISVMFYSIFKHRKSKNFEPSQFSHSTSVEIVWTIIPFFILIGMAIPATKVLINMEDTTKSDLTIKITGYQWKWGYEYLNSDVSFYSTLTTPVEQINQFDTENAVKQEENYLLEVDNYLVVPAGRKVRALITANDVIHAWWIPAFGTKKDAIPGYINELWFNVDEDKTGIYRGQCAELCGKDHAFMPIVVKVVSGAEFDQWLAAGGTFDVSPIAEQPKAKVIDAQPVTAQLIDETQSLTTVSEVTNSVVDAIVTPANAEAVAVSEEVDVNVNTDEVDVNAEDVVQEAAAVDAIEGAQEVITEAIVSDELMAAGKKVYATCSACHGADGQGIPGVFPAIAGSPVAAGPIEDHIDIVMFGKAGTAMAAFASQLSDQEIAAVVTYQRNSFGNSTGDAALPADIKAKRN